jgi:hypothetical protein
LINKISKNELEYCIEIGINKVTDNTISKGSKGVYIDNEGYLYSLSTENIKVMMRRKSTPAKFFRENPYTIDNIKLFIKLNSNNIDLISNTIVNAKDTLEFSCLNHGSFSKSWNEIKSGHYCPKCGINQGAFSRRNNIEDIRNSFFERNYILTSTEYTNNEELLDYSCLKHENEGLQKISWGNFIANKGCNYCGRENMILKQSKTHGQFVSELNIIHKNRYRVENEYINSKMKVCIYCVDCKSSFSSKSSHLLDGHMGCNCKSKSIGEDKIRSLLENNKIPFEQQYKFTDCKYKRSLPFDFAVFSNQCKTDILYLVEFNGKQHYEATGWSSDENKNKKRFIEQQRNDNTKRKYCIDNNIKLFEIPYWEIGNIENILFSHEMRLSW